jgi:hypothetical protein
MFINFSSYDIGNQMLSFFQQQGGLPFISEGIQHLSGACLPASARQEEQEQARLLHPETTQRARGDRKHVALSSIREQPG